MAVRLLVAACIALAAWACIAAMLLESTAQWTYLPQCDSTAGDQALFDYMYWYQCSTLLPGYGKALILMLWLLILISLLGTTADNFFVPVLEELSSSMGLSEEVAGITLLALGNGMPDLMTASSAIGKADDFGLVMGNIFGGSCFVLAVVLGAVLLCSQEVPSVEPKSFLLLTVCYIVAISAVFVVTYDHSISLFESFGFLVFYAVYVCSMILLSRRSQASVAEKTDQGLSTAMSTMESGEALDDALDSGCVANAEEMGVFERVQVFVELPFSCARHASIPSAVWGSKHRRLASVCPLCGALISIIGFGGDWGALAHPVGRFPVAGWACIFGVVLGAMVLGFSTSTRKPCWHPILLGLGFLFTVAWFNIFAKEVVALLSTFGEIFEISSSILGITVLAWGNCIGDFVADVALARQGKTRMAIAGIFGSLIFSDLVGLGTSLLVYTSRFGRLGAALDNLNVTAAIFLFSSVGLTVWFFVLNRFKCPRWYSSVLLLEYVAFMAVTVVMEIRTKKA